MYYVTCNSSSYKKDENMIGNTMFNIFLNNHPYVCIHKHAKVWLSLQSKVYGIAKEREPKYLLLPTSRA